ncbi:MAG: pentapeptide repeat-containing protein [Candidatus Omnitrophica bacterium]|nr:pentapeptide repeat-containing protein [Candidatus Omnitrophota bacterium]
MSLSDFCWRHIEDKNAYRQELTDYISTSGSIKDFCLRRLEFPEAEWQSIDAEGADLGLADLAGADLTAANLKGSNLIGANLQQANMASVDLEGAHLLKADLSGARLWNAHIKDATLAEANFQEADFLKATLSGVRFWHVKLEKAKFLTRHNFIGDKPIDEKGLLSAGEAYRNLKQHFMSEGRYDDASWASFKEKQLERRQLFKSRKLAYIPSLLMAGLCGYGEKPYRVVISSAVLISLYSFVYISLGVLHIPESYVRGGLNFWDYLYFSIVTFTTVGFGDLVPVPVPLFQMLVGSEAFIGVFMMGLFIFTLARKHAAR